MEKRTSVTDPSNMTALEVRLWAQDALRECRASLEREKTAWDEVVGLRREIKRLDKLVQFVSKPESSE
jgi:hypothetical protein